ncbi:MAG: ParB N-terminal domain-containing protein [Chloroflexota bacterium]|nr:ParB N-terminal domain-containing protein [Chloroflexota bacterium]
MSTKTLAWTTEKRMINDLLPYEHNPRKLTPKQHDDLKQSLEKFDLAEIPVVNVDNTIIAGHMRLRILQELGRGDEYVDVRIPSRKLTTKELQEYNIRSNKNIGDWDFDILSKAFDIKELVDWGFEPYDFNMLVLDRNEEDAGTVLNYYDVVSAKSGYFAVGNIGSQIELELLQHVEALLKKSMDESGCDARPVLERLLILGRDYW